MFDDIDPYALQVARWLEHRVREQEAKFPRLKQLKADILSATDAVEAAVTDEQRGLALDRQTKAIYALISSMPV